MSDSISSFPSRDISSIISLKSYINEGNLPKKGLFDFDPSESVLSRSLSTCSATSGVSITGIKDGIEGKHIIKTGLNHYSLKFSEPKYLNPKHFNDSPISRCSSRFNFDKSHNSTCVLMEEPRTENQVQQFPELMLTSCSTPVYPDSPSSPPMTLREKMKLLNIDRPYSFENSKHSHHKNIISNDSINLLHNVNNESIDSYLLGPSMDHNKSWDTFDTNYKTSKLKRELNLYHPSGGNDPQSNTSILGDDESYLSTFRNLHDKENFDTEIDNNSNEYKNNNNYRPNEIQLFQSNEALE